MTAKIKAPMSGKPYTPEENELILAANYGDTLLLAERLGRTVNSIRSHRELLRRGPKSESTARYRAPPRPPPNVAARFARPAWFDEDITKMITRGR